ncbi:glycosyltransferase family 2 protein [Sulfurimonas sp.]|uniref:glycosyltransferase family 2 protein n=1 Tax=Sulfurimonas sp. TaxID=2022749 RepID=UPI00262DF704|nr:glycosyltransferase family 2 protein [Sulfurimonas sp.]
MNITATIITLNEAENIKDVILSAKEVCNEIIVIDSQSTDRTRELAEELGAKVIIQPYLGDGPQKAFGVQFATNNWILSLDADERLDSDAINEIKKLNLQNTEYDGYSFARKTFVGKKLIRQWYPDRVVRLYNHNKCIYSTSGGHAKVQTKNAKNLNAHILHYSYKNYEEVIQTSYKFIERGARLAHQDGKRASKIDPFLHGFGALFKSLVLKKGIFYGIDEIHIAVISSFSAYMKYALMLEMQENNSLNGK